VVISEYLTGRGYQVDVAPTGMEALSLLKQDRGRIALAVVDFCMPGMCGDELLRVIEGRYPGLPAILMSGFGAHVWDYRGLTYPWRVGVLGKPFPLAELETLVKDGLRK